MILEEPVSISSDRRSISLKAPVSSAGSVRILANNAVYIPPGGLGSQAVLTGASPGPFKILRCTEAAGPDGNVITVTTGAGSATVRITEGNQITLAQVQRTLRLSGVNDLVSVTERNGALSLVDAQYAGEESFIRVSGRAASSLGFIQTGARGATVYPGWDIISKEDVNPIVHKESTTLVPARYPRFKAPLRGNPSLKVTYASMPERCPRCGATYVENDWRFDANGEVVTIQNEDVLYQACMKAILTVKGSNAFHPNYGSKTLTRIGQKAVGSSLNLIREDVMTALSQVKTLQNGQRNYQTVSSRELLYTIQSVNVRVSAEDQTVFFIDVVVRNGSNKPVNLTTVFSVPGAIALAGTNGLSLGIEKAGLTNAQLNRLLLD